MPMNAAARAELMWPPLKEAILDKQDALTLTALGHTPIRTALRVALAEAIAKAVAEVVCEHLVAEIQANAVVTTTLTSGVTTGATSCPAGAGTATTGLTNRAATGTVA